MMETARGRPSHRLRNMAFGFETKATISDRGRLFLVAGRRHASAERLALPPRCRGRSAGAPRPRRRVASKPSRRSPSSSRPSRRTRPPRRPRPAPQAHRGRRRHAGAAASGRSRRFMRCARSDGRGRPGPERPPRARRRSCGRGAAACAASIRTGAATAPTPRPWAAEEGLADGRAAGSRRAVEPRACRFPRATSRDPGAAPADA